MTTTNNTNGRRKHNRNNMPQSEVLDRKARKVGSDDMQSAALVCKWAENAGLRGPNLAVAASIAKAFEAAVALSLDGQHRDAAKKAASAQYVLKRNEHVAKLKLQCRDGRERKIGQIAEWYASVHFRVADEIDAALEAEAKAAEERRLEAEQRRASKEAARAAAESKEVKAA
jgi:hypothetical protein